MEVSLKILKNWGKFFLGMCFLIKIFHFFWKQVFGKHILGVRMFGENVGFTTIFIGVYVGFKVIWVILGYFNDFYGLKV